MSLNNMVLLRGNLGKNPEIRYTGKGTPVSNFSIATDSHWMDEEGQRQHRVEWHSIVVWGRLAEVCVKYLMKGQSVTIRGELLNKKYRDRTGIDRQKAEIHAAEIDFGTKPRMREDDGQDMRDDDFEYDDDQDAGQEAR